MIIAIELTFSETPRLTLNGFHVEEQEITSMSTNEAALRKLGRIISDRLNINYFDSEDVSIG